MRGKFIEKSLALALIILIFGALSVNAASGETKILPSDGTDEGSFGRSVSISGDYMIVGDCPTDVLNTEPGSAYIFHHDGTAWTQQAKFTISDLDFDFGRSVSISGDYAIVGASRDHVSDDDLGSAYIYHRNGATWTQQAKLIAIDGSAGFGYSVSIFGDYAIVGDLGDDSAYIFHHDGTTWTQQAKLTVSDSELAFVFGNSVSIYGDYAIVGACGTHDGDGHANYSGSAFIFHRNGTAWTQQAKLTASDAMEDDWFGWSVSISGDYAIVGALGDDYDDSYDDYDDYSGAAYIFHRNGTTWTQQAKLTASDFERWDWFGKSVSISGDCAIIGSGKDDGSAYIFYRNGTTWTQQAKLTVADGLGYSVSISGDYAIAGAPGSFHDNGSRSGAAYIYDMRAAHIYDPFPGSKLCPTDMTFTWNDSGADYYQLLIGTSEGADDIYSGALLTDTSVTVSDLPDNGQTLYVRLFSVVDEEWLSYDYTYTASSPPAPLPITLENGTATFSQNGLSPDHAVDGIGADEGYSGSNCWAVYGQGTQGGTKEQTAVWETSADLAAGQLKFKMHFKHPATGHAIGRFRLSVTADDRSEFADGENSDGDVEANWIELTNPSVSLPSG
ncbi:MAG: hypothetical protein GY749_49990, partial [Desulfobacteraceae bacterium]|nr:hypothetical protein [Desulfobacteraceae bacterium]